MVAVPQPPPGTHAVGGAGWTFVGLVRRRTAGAELVASLQYVLWSLSTSRCRMQRCTVEPLACSETTFVCEQERPVFVEWRVDVAGVADALPHAASAAASVATKSGVARRPPRSLSILLILLLRPKTTSTPRGKRRDGHRLAHPPVAVRHSTAT